MPALIAPQVASWPDNRPLMQNSNFRYADRTLHPKQRMLALPTTQHRLVIEQLIILYGVEYLKEIRLRTGLQARNRSSAASKARGSASAVLDDEHPAAVTTLAVDKAVTGAILGRVDQAKFQIIGNEPASEQYPFLADLFTAIV